LINAVGTLVWAMRYGANGCSLTTALAFAEFPPCFLLVKLDVAAAAGRTCMKISGSLDCIFVGMALILFWVVGTAHAEMASVYGGRDGFCGSRTANGERVNCSAMTAAHRRLPFGTRVRVCHSGCVTVRINDRGPFVRGRDIDLSPAAARAIGLGGIGHVTVSRL
jgi:peptidoglycan lytic transglycosylase